MGDLMDALFDDSVKPAQSDSPKWPHKCGVCGRFVKHDELWGRADRDGEYDATAHCDNCGKRTDAYPI